MKKQTSYLFILTCFLSHLGCECPDPACPPPNVNYEVSLRMNLERFDPADQISLRVVVRDRRDGTALDTLSDLGTDRGYLTLGSAGHVDLTDRFEQVEEEAEYDFDILIGSEIHQITQIQIRYVPEECTCGSYVIDRFTFNGQTIEVNTSRYQWVL